jgi:hypothetical protein
MRLDKHRSIKHRDAAIPQRNPEKDGKLALSDSIVYQRAPSELRALDDRFTTSGKGLAFEISSPVFAAVTAPKRSHHGNRRHEGGHKAQNGEKGRERDP